MPNRAALRILAASRGARKKLLIVLAPIPTESSSEMLLSMRNDKRLGYR